MVSIRPTWAVDRSKLLPIALRRPTGTNSVVLKIKAARARAITLSQLPEPTLEGVFMKKCTARKEMTPAILPCTKTPAHERIDQGIRPCTRFSVIGLLWVWEGTTSGCEWYVA
ncbi:hypothetical protein D3C85_750330 [compost metagenome]